MNTVETALGPIATAELGQTLMHEHVVTRSPGVQENWPHLWDRPGILAMAERKMADLYSRGIRTIVDLTTVDLGRDIDLILGVARRSRVHVSSLPASGGCRSATSPPRRRRGGRAVRPRHHAGHRRQRRQGRHHQVRHRHRRRDPGDRERPAGLGPGPEGDRRADLDPHLGGRAHRREQQAIFAQEGVDLSRVIIGHSGDSEDLGYLRGLMERGSTIGMDRFGLENFLSTPKRVEVMARLCAEGYAGKMVLSHDANCWSDMLSEDAKRRTPAALALQPHLRRHPAGAAQGRRHRGADRPDAGGQPARDLRGAKGLKR